MTRRRILLSAYTCAPGEGSEPEVGWNVAVGLARHHDVWVLVRSMHRPRIEAALAAAPVPGLRFVYYEVPMWPARLDYRDDKAAMETMKAKVAQNMADCMALSAPSDTGARVRA